MIKNHYKLIDEHPDRYEIHDERDGRSFEVSKRHLNLEMHGRLSKIQKYAKGGAIQASKQPTDAQVIEGLSDKNQSEASDFIPSTLTADAPSMGSSEPEAFPSPSPQGQEASLKGQAINAEPANQDIAKAANMDNIQQPSMNDLVQKSFSQKTALQGLDEQERAINEANSAEMMVGQKKAQAYQKMADIEKTMPTPNDIQARYQKENDALLKAFADKEIDPNHFWHDKGELEKGVLAFSMALGGANAVNNVFKRVEADVEAQKNARDKAYTLYRLNLEKTQNAQLAAMKTKDQLLTGLQYEAQAADALAQGPRAKAANAQVKAQIVQQKALLQRKMSLLEAATVAEKGGSLINADPTNYLDLIDNPEQRKEASQQVDRAKKLKTLKEGMQFAQDELSKLSFGGHLSPARRDALINSFTPQVATLFAHRFTEQDARAIVEAYLTHGFESNETSNLRVKLLDDAFNSERNEQSAFKNGTGGVDLNNFPSTHLGSSVRTEMTKQRLDQTEIKSYIQKNLNSKDPQVKQRVKFLLQNYGAPR